MGKSDFTLDELVDRSARANEIIADYERQHDFQLPQPWRDAMPRLLLHGLSDHDLHLIFETLMLVEYQAGRLAPREFDPSKFFDK